MLAENQKTLFRKSRVTLGISVFSYFCLHLEYLKKKLVKTYRTVNIFLKKRFTPICRKRFYSRFTVKSLTRSKARRANSRVAYSYCNHVTGGNRRASAGENGSECISPGPACNGRFRKSMHTQVFHRHRYGREGVYKNVSEPCCECIFSPITTGQNTDESRRSLPEIRPYKRR